MKMKRYFLLASFIVLAVTVNAQSWTDAASQDREVSNGETLVGRRSKINEYVALAQKAEKRAAIDNSLRCYYWALVLLNTLPDKNTVSYTDSDGSEYMLSSWIPRQINEIVGKVDVRIIKKSRNSIDIAFLYGGKPVSSIDYVFFDGKDSSDVCHAQDGRGVIELCKEANIEKMMLRCEYVYEKQAALLDRDVAVAMATQEKRTFRNAMKKIVLESPNDFDVTSSVFTDSTAKHDLSAVTSAIGNVADSKKKLCNATLEKVIAAINSKKYASVEDCFTADGYDVFVRLIQYGRASVIRQLEYCYAMQYDHIAVRGITMGFRFKDCAFQSFVENVVFLFNSDGKIDDISFGLDAGLTNDIMSHKPWKMEVRLAIINFLETFKTSFALKRLIYLSALFGDDAIILCCSNAFVTMNSTHNVEVQTNRYQKSALLNHLRACFSSKEFVCLRFCDLDVNRNAKSEVYGLQLKLDYFSADYGESGSALFLIDMTNNQEPVMKLSTWQYQIDPDDGRPFIMSDFDAF